MKQIHTGHPRSLVDPLKIATLAALLATGACVSTAGEGTGGGVPMTDVQTVNVGGYVSTQIATDREYVKKTLPVALDLVWAVLPGVYQELGIPVVTSNPSTNEVGNPGFEVARVGGSRMNKYLDCGTSRTGPMANAYQVTLSVMTKLSELEGGQTELSSVVDGTAVNRTTAGYPVPCSSREELEELIVEKVAEALGISGP